MTRVVAVIPARGGSKSIPRKNLALFGGIPLIGRTISAALNAALIDEVYCTSDDAEILSCAAQHGAKIIQRPGELAQDKSSSELALLHALDVIEQAGQPVGVVVFLQCTSPFTTSDDIDLLVNVLRHSPNADCSLLVAASHTFLWRANEAGHAVGINHNHEVQRLLRQDLPPEYQETGAGYAMHVDAFRRVGRRFCGNVALAISKSPAIEIDEIADLEHARAIFASHTRPSYPGLKHVKALVTDFDGVHTDDKVIVADDGSESVRCSRSDGYGYSLLKTLRIRPLIISREKNLVVSERARKLSIEVLQGVENKLEVLSSWLNENQLSWKDIAYIGNDLNDLECLERAGHPYLTADAHESVHGKGFSVLTKAGGNGAIRELIDHLVKAHTQS